MAVPNVLGLSGLRRRMRIDARVLAAWLRRHWRALLLAGVAIYLTGPDLNVQWQEYLPPRCPVGADLVDVPREGLPDFGGPVFRYQPLAVPACATYRYPDPNSPTYRVVSGYRLPSSQQPAQHQITFTL